MRSSVVVLALAAGVLAAAAYYWRDRWMPAERAYLPPPASQQRTPSRAEPQPEPSLEREARQYVESVSASEPQAVSIGKADHFVRRDQVIALPDEKEVETLTVRELMARPDLSDDTPITLLRSVEQVEYLTPEQLLAQTDGDLDAAIRIIEDDRVSETTVREALEKLATTPTGRIPFVRNVDYPEKTTRGRVGRDESLTGETSIRVVTGPYRTGSATVGDLMAGIETASEESVYYVRTVRKSDTDGIWGIIHDGLVENFARGVALRRGEAITTYQVAIPRDADERLADRSSSFLGKLIHQKMMATHVYNHRQRRMGRNPDYISPGQEIVIVTFTPDELVTIYKHFVSGTG